MPTTRSRNSVAIAAKVKHEPSQLPTPASTPKPRQTDSKRGTAAKPATKRKRVEQDDSPSKEIKKEPEDERPKNEKQSRSKASTGKKTSKGPSQADLEAGSKMAAAFAENRDAQRLEPSDPKKNTYGFLPGQSPYPNYPRPTPQDCQEVCDILSKAHGKVQAPKTIPQPSLNNSGCGEVPSVLDALVRTRLSAATNNANSSRAFRGLVEKFGTIKSGIGKGSVNWDAVRRAPTRDVFEAIKSGGLADVKSRHIQQILQMVHDENQARRKNLEQGEKKGDPEADKEDEDEAERRREVSRAEENVLSLDHLHLLDNETAFNKLLAYPGIGPKTASCVLLFCMQRPSFAVDTHVFRLTKWLGWVPSDAKAKALAKALAKEQGTKPKGSAVTRESAYAHLDVRVPDDLKYPLHYLLIKHGKNCGWCSAKAGKDAKVGVCPLAKLMSGKGRAKGLAKSGETDADLHEVDDDISSEEEED